MTGAPNHVPLISIVIPVFEIATYLQECIDSIQSQSYRNFEIIAIDDGSSPAASQVIQEICNAHRNVKLVRQKHAGQATARRTGYSHARGELIIFIDADDRLLPEALKRFEAALRQNPSCIATYGRRITFDTLTARLSNNALPPHSYCISGDLLPSLLEGRSLLASGGVCISKSAISKSLFCTELTMGEDWVTWCRLARSGTITYLGPEPVAVIRIHEGNISRKAFAFPSPLFPMLDAVFKADEFATIIDAASLSYYRHKHAARICRYLARGYRRQGKLLLAVYYQLKFMLTDWRRLRYPSGRIRVLHVVKRFYAGGAERLLSDLLAHTDHTRFEHFVVSLSDKGERLGNIQPHLGIPYRSLAYFPQRLSFLNSLMGYLYVWYLKPDVVKTWLPPANITGGKWAKFWHIPVVWGMHNARPAAEHNMRQFRLSRSIPRRIVCCSDAVRAICRELGYDEHLLSVISNGIDIDRFVKDPSAGVALRRSLSIPPYTPLIGMAAEFIPIKRHAYFLQAAQQLLGTHPDARFLLCGKDTDLAHPAVQELINTCGLDGKVHALGIRDDMVAIYSALDIHTQVSSSESFGLSTAEAMACETLCVATDVGIMRALLSDYGFIISVEDDPSLLANGWRNALALTHTQRSTRTEKGREHIVHHYPISTTAQAYDRLYASVAEAS